MLKALKTAIIIGLCVAGLSSAAMAQKSPVDFSGKYIGIDFNGLSFDHTAVSTQTKSMFSDFGVAGRVGYGQQFANGVYVGGEVSDGTRSGITRYGNVEDSVGNDLALDFRLGDVVLDNLLYGKVGYALTSVTSKDTATGISNSETMSGVRFGGGVERYLGNYTSLRLETMYTDYQTSYLGANKVDPSNLTAKIGLSFKLD